jgi:hypothetical protein
MPQKPIELPVMQDLAPAPGPPQPAGMTLPMA